MSGTEFSVFFEAIKVDLFVPGPDGSPTKEYTPFNLYGRDVYAEFLFIQRQGAQRGRDCRWVWNTPMKESTIAAYIKRVAESTSLGEDFKPGQLRHHYATILFWGWASRTEKPGFDLAALQGLMRHSNSQITLRHYVRHAPAPAILARWGDIGYQRLAQLSSSELLRC